MTHGSLFSGIGGFDLAAECMGWNNLFHCEINPFAQQVLKYYWPNAISHDDITSTDFTIYRGRIDVLSGGFPCQPFSNAGKRQGTADPRHLWPEMLRAIREISPRYVVGENVRGLVNWNGGMVFEMVQADLEAAGYEVLPVLLPACAVGAPHRRDRVWFVAHAGGEQFQKRPPLGIGKNTTQEGARLDNRDKRHGNPRFAADTASDRRKREGKEAKAKKGRQSGSESAGELEGGFEGLRSNEFAADTNGSEFQTPWSQQQTTGTTGNGSQGPASDTDSNGLEGSLSTIEHQQSRIPEGDASECLSAHQRRIRFQGFPTQSPVCGGDDGLPRELDGITFSKWRQESIKGYGNAVVPQVVIQLFKVIQTIETQ